MTKNPSHMEQGSTLPLTDSKTEARIDTRLLASHLGSQHESLLKTISTHQTDFEQLGKVRFQIGASPGSRTGQAVKFALLNEDQAYLLLTYSRNSVRVRELKIRLVKTFREARLSADLRKAEYLPTYHWLHDAIRDLAGGSPNERFVHCNVNKLVNKAVGIEAGCRSSASLPQQSILTVAQAIAARAFQSAPDHHDGYQSAKLALAPLMTMASTLRVGDPANAKLT